MVYKLKLKGGLCNKLFCLFSGVEIAIREKEKLLEPNFGLRNEILFSAFSGNWEKNDVFHKEIWTVRLL